MASVQASAREDSMVVSKWKPVHFLGGIAWITFFGGMWLYMLGISAIGVVWLPMVLSFAMGILAAIFSQVD